MHLAGVTVGAKVELEILWGAINDDPPFTRSSQGLGNEVTRQNVVPDAPGELVTPISRLRSVAGKRLEKIPTARRPQRVGALGRHAQGVRNNPCALARRMKLTRN